MVVFLLGDGQVQAGQRRPNPYSGEVVIYESVRTDTTTNAFGRGPRPGGE